VRLFHLSVLFLIITAFSGCKTLVLDEAFVFQPGQFGDPNAIRTGQKSSVQHDLLKAGANNHIAISLIEREGVSRPLVIHCGGNASDRYETGVLYAQKIITIRDMVTVRGRRMMSVCGKPIKQSRDM